MMSQKPYCINVYGIQNWLGSLKLGMSDVVES
jgi:hypothetical protein